MLFSMSKKSNSTSMMLKEKSYMPVTMTTSIFSQVKDKHRVRTHWTDKICLALPKISTKFVSAKFLICQVWAHWITAKYLLTTSVNHNHRSSSGSNESYFAAYFFGSLPLFLLSSALESSAWLLSIWLHVVVKLALVLVLGWLGWTYGRTNWAELGPGDAAGTLT